MPSRETLKRLATLEGQAARHTGTDPFRIHQAMIGFGLEAPEPQAGEDTPTWLRRVPKASLDAVINHRRNAYAQS